MGDKMSKSEHKGDPYSLVLYVWGALHFGAPGVPGKLAEISEAGSRRIKARLRRVGASRLQSRARCHLALSPLPPIFLGRRYLLAPHHGRTARTHRPREPRRPALGKRTSVQRRVFGQHHGAAASPLAHAGARILVH